MNPSEIDSKPLPESDPKSGDHGASGVDPRVSVVIPSYNSARYLGEAIGSVLEQTYARFEIIVIDDGSTDNTREVAEGFGDARIRYFHQENQGLAASRNAGAAKSRAEYLVYLDADDWLLPKKLAAQLAFMDSHPEFGLVGGAMIRTDHEGRWISRSPIDSGEIDARALFTSNPFAVHALMIRRSCVEEAGGFDTDLGPAADWDLYCRMMLAGNRMYRDREPVCLYRATPSGMTADPSRQTDDELRVVERTFGDGRLAEALRPMKDTALGKVYLTGALRAFTQIQGEMGKEYLTRALALLPSLGRDDCQALIEYLGYRAVEASAPERYLAEVYANLPDEADAVRGRFGEVKFLASKDRVARAWLRKDWVQFLGSAAALLARHPIQTPLYYASRGRSNSA